MLPLDKGFGPSLVVASERWTGRVGVFLKSPLGTLEPLEYLAILKGHSDVFGRAGRALPLTYPGMGGQE